MTAISSRQRACEEIGGLPFEALTPLTPLSQRERGEQEKIQKTRFLSFSLLSLWERRAGEVRASKGKSPDLPLTAPTPPKSPAPWPRAAVRRLPAASGHRWG